MVGWSPQKNVVYVGHGQGASVALHAAVRGPQVLGVLAIDGHLTPAHLEHKNVGPENTARATRVLLACPRASVSALSDQRQTQRTLADQQLPTVQVQAVLFDSDFPSSKVRIVCIRRLNSQHVVQKDILPLMGFFSTLLPRRMAALERMATHVF
jgi:pimeloyl-ACP methyl ester carboxylesterase